MFTFLGWEKFEKAFDTKFNAGSMSVNGNEVFGPLAKFNVPSELFESRIDSEIDNHAL